MRPAACVLLLAILVTPVDTLARQNASEEGRVVRTGWPDAIYESEGAMVVPGMRAAENFGDAALIARIDTLVLDYAWRVEDDLPHVEFDLWWVRGRGGVVDGIVTTETEMPADVRIDLVDLHAEVHVDGVHAGDLVLTLDSLALAPAPDAFAFETVGVTWSDVFAAMDSTAARRAFEHGFTLARLDILRIAFVEVAAPEPPERDVPVVVRQPTRRTIFVPDMDVWIGWNIGPDPYRPRPRPERRRWAPRGDQAGRTDNTARRSPRRGEDREASGRTRSEDDGRASIPDIGGKKKSSDDDDDDDRDLLGPALIGLAAVGALAYGGGTFGLQANGDTPAGLFAGAIRPRWAFFMHAAVNTDVITAGDDEKARGGMLWFLRPVAVDIRPGFGFGARLHEVGDDIEVEPVVDLGLLFTADQLVLLGSVDVLTGTPRFGIGVNLRAPRRR